MHAKSTFKRKYFLTKNKGNILSIPKARLEVHFLEHLEENIFNK